MDFKKLTTTTVVQIEPSTIVFTKACYCVLPYPHRKKGCPNYGNKFGCPPMVPYLEEIKTKYKYFYLVYSVFDLKTYSDHIRKLHPNFTDKQCRNLRFYQKSIKNILVDKILELKLIDSRFNTLGCGSGFKECLYSMEAVGIQVFDTCKNNGIILDRNPIDKVTFVCLLYTNYEINMNKSTNKKLMEC